jgi:hypothetical protein
MSGFIPPTYEAGQQLRQKKYANLGNIFAKLSLTIPGPSRLWLCSASL